MNGAGAATRDVRGIWRRRRKIAADAGTSPSRGHLSTAEYKWLSELFQSMILMAGDQESLPPALRHVMAGRGRFMRASAVSIDTHMLVWRVENRQARRRRLDIPKILMIDRYDQ